MDNTETIKRKMCEEINGNPSERELLEKKYGQVWTAQEVSKDFDIIGFGAPLVVVIRKSDRQKGSLYFQDQPRFYYGFKSV